VIGNLINIILFVLCIFLSIFFFYTFALTSKNKQESANPYMVLSILFITLLASIVFSAIIHPESEYSYIYASMELIFLYISSFFFHIYSRLISGKLSVVKYFLILLFSIAILLVLSLTTELIISHRLIAIVDIFGTTKKLPVQGPAYLWIELITLCLILISTGFLLSVKKWIALFSILIISPFIVAETLEKFSIINFYLFYNNITVGISFCLISTGFASCLQSIKKIYPQLRKEETEKKGISSEEILSFQEDLTILRNFVEKISPRTEEINHNKKELENLVKDAYGAINETPTKIKDLLDFSKTFQESFENRKEAFKFLINNWNLYRSRLKQISESGTEIANSIDNLTGKVNSGKELVNTNLTTLTHIKDSVKELNIVVKSIEDLAEQTNLLSINTAIEVYHSEQKEGGFSVIAEEISETALSVLNTSLDISGSIQKIMENATEIEERVKNIDQIFSDFLKNIEMLFVYMSNIAYIIKELDGSILNFLKELEKKYDLPLKGFQIETETLPLLQKQKAFLDKLSSFMPTLLSLFDILQTYVSIKERLEKYNESLNKLLSEKGRKDSSL